MTSCPAARQALGEVRGTSARPRRPCTGRGSRRRCRRAQEANRRFTDREKKPEEARPVESRPVSVVAETLSEAKAGRSRDEVPAGDRPRPQRGGLDRARRREMRAADPGFEILVIDDGSNDAHRRGAARREARVVRLPFNLGIGGAVQTGYRYAHDTATTSPSRSTATASTTRAIAACSSRSSRGRGRLAMARVRRRPATGPVVARRIGIGSSRASSR